jgi:hypothetical protein
MTTTPQGKAVRTRRASITVSHEAHGYLREQPVEETLLPAARSVLGTCLGLRPGAHCILVATVECEQLAAALVRGGEALGLELSAYLVDELQAQNAAFLSRLSSRLGAAAGSVLVGGSNTIPDPFRQLLRDLRGSERRHAELVDVGPAVFRQSVRADYQEMHELGQRLSAQLDGSNQLDVHSPVGTALSLVFEPRPRSWTHHSGLLTEPGWTSLPAGVFTLPVRRADGTFVPDGGIWLPDGEPLGRGMRIQLQFEHGRLRSVDRGAKGADAEKLKRYRGCRVTHLGLGTNASVVASIGDWAQDRTMPGVHLMLESRDGSPEAPVAVLGRRPDVSADGVPLLVRGRYARNLMP